MLDNRPSGKFTAPRFGGMVELLSVPKFWLPGKGDDSMVGRIRSRPDLRPHRALVVRMHRDDETGGWWADSDDIPGLTSEAPTYDSLCARVWRVVPELCQANGINLVNCSVNFQPKPKAHTMERQDLDSALSELGNRIWEAIQSDPVIMDSLFTLADMKLTLDNVTPENSNLDPDAAKAIFGDVEADSQNLVRPKAFVPSREWAKNALYNLALDWVVDQALMRMRLESKWPFQQEEGLQKP